MHLAYMIWFSLSLSFFFSFKTSLISRDINTVYQASYKQNRNEKAFIFISICSEGMEGVF